MEKEAVENIGDLEEVQAEQPNAKKHKDNHRRAWKGVALAVFAAVVAIACYDVLAITTADVFAQDDLTADRFVKAFNEYSAKPQYTADEVSDVSALDELNDHMARSLTLLQAADDFTVLDPAAHPSVISEMEDELTSIPPLYEAVEADARAKACKELDVVVEGARSILSEIGEGAEGADEVAALMGEVEGDGELDALTPREIGEKADRIGEAAQAAEQAYAERVAEERRQAEEAEARATYSYSSPAQSTSAGSGSSDSA